MHSQSAIPLPVEAPSAFAFGPFVLIPDQRLLLAEGAPLKVGGRALEILTVLVQRQGAIVTKHDLMARVWPDVAVEEGNLKANVAALRRALGDDTDQPRYIATVVGRGYRFITPVRRAEVTARPVTTSPRQPAGNLPALATRVFGRATVIASIRRDFETSSLVSVVGPGGMGKTTVAVAVAHEAAPTFEDGARFVDLAVVSDGARVPFAVATALGLHPGAGALSAYLRERQVLLVLDNCEHVIDAVASFAHQVTTNATKARLLVTSREPLSIKGERVRRLSGLDTPPPSPLLRAEEALHFAAVQLFVERASRTSRAFALSDANAATVAELCRRLDGLALAIEGLAARVDTLAIGEMLDYVEGDLHLLDVCRPGLERQRTLSAALDWSYQLLSERERAVLRRLSTLGGDFDLERACAVATSDGDASISVVEDVASLAAKSLLTVESQRGQVRYRLTHVARAFAQAKLSEAGGGMTSRNDRREQ